MSVSLREMYDKIRTQSNEDISKFISNEEINELDSYKSLESLKTLLNKLDEERSASKDDSENIVACTDHTSFAIKNDKISLNKVKEVIPKIKRMSCMSDIIQQCDCQVLTGCECNTRTLTCDSVVSYSVTPVCNSRTVDVVSCDCNGVTATGTNYYYYYYTYVAYYTSYYYVYYRAVIGMSATDNGCSSKSYGSACGVVSYFVYTYVQETACGCNSVPVYSSGTGTGTYYYYYTTYYCTSRTSYKIECNCESRTTTNACACNSRSTGLCVSREGCSCDQVCYCNTVKQFGNRRK
jgi:hypothetical protein